MHTETSFENPWTTIASELKYENPWINVREDKVLTPTGKEGIYGVVSFKNKAIGIVPIDENNNVYLVGQWRYPLEAYSWEIPEGGGPDGEDPMETAKRELKEETGLLAKEWTFLGNIHTSNSVCDEIGYLYLAQNLTQVETSPEETEVLTIKKISLKLAIDMVMASEITDSLAISGLMMAARKLGI
ncbi:MAG: NUDIX domain-containing protein [Cytophagales bacterium]